MFWGRPGSLLEPSCGVLEAGPGVLEAGLGVLEAGLSVLEASWDVLGSPWRVLESLFPSTGMKPQKYFLFQWNFNDFVVRDSSLVG